MLSRATCDFPQGTLFFDRYHDTWRFRERERERELGVIHCYLYDERIASMQLSFCMHEPARDVSGARMRRKLKKIAE